MKFEVKFEALAVALELISASWGGTGRTRYTFTPVGDGTRVDWHWDFAMRGWLRPFDGLLASTFTRAFRRDLDRLRSMMEAGEL